LTWLNQQIELPHPQLLAMEQFAKEHKVPVAPCCQVGHLLFWLCQLTRPHCILELDAAIGYSTAWLAFGAPLGCHC
jgi:predicted O-methyltransferase YrrM